MVKEKNRKTSPLNNEEITLEYEWRREEGRVKDFSFVENETMRVNESDRLSVSRVPSTFPK